jgi:hypothetical protein
LQRIARRPAGLSAVVGVRSREAAKTREATKTRDEAVDGFPERPLNQFRCQRD